MFQNIYACKIYILILYKDIHKPKPPNVDHQQG
jgi:hypothetical protein